MNTTRLHSSAENLSKDYLSPCECHIVINILFNTCKKFYTSR